MDIMTLKMMLPLLKQNAYVQGKTIIKRGFQFTTTEKMVLVKFTITWNFMDTTNNVIISGDYGFLQ